jgi:hypothetical protein
MLRDYYGTYHLALREYKRRERKHTRQPHPTAASQTGERDGRGRGWISTSSACSDFEEEEPAGRRRSQLHGELINEDANHE